MRRIAITAVFAVLCSSSVAVACPRHLTLHQAGLAAKGIWSPEIVKSSGCHWISRSAVDCHVGVRVKVNTDGLRWDGWLWGWERVRWAPDSVWHQWERWHGYRVRFIGYSRAVLA